MKVPDRAQKAAVDNAVVVKRLTILKGKVSILHWGNINGASRARLQSLKAPVPKNTSSFERIVSKRECMGQQRVRGTLLRQGIKAVSVASCCCDKNAIAA